ncbi:4Fe-4S cluster-binding domain-containing protein [Hyphomonas sp.]|uniref:4Fe-4S cluster-binding domain-containing protein n=1 Tax=Hyphomonas sp. TaxID=87 RepID=UPI0025C256EF|nr:4Fe-4S cluster-binding domain-containing protein [Hyphomonas sp.]
MNVFVSRLHFPVTALGPGQRIGLWFQGCSIGCAGCVSVDTWSRTEVTPTSLKALQLQLAGLLGRAPDGITISGGEPFEQPEALAAIVDFLREETRRLPRFDILIYSGMPLKRVRRFFPDILSKADAVIAEPYVRERGEGDALRGSANQILVPLSDTGALKYCDVAAWPRSMQISIESTTVSLIGVPRPGTLEALEELLRQQGVEFGAVTWRN